MVLYHHALRTLARMEAVHRLDAEAAQAARAELEQFFGRAPPTPEVLENEQDSPAEESSDEEP
jgi:hypothetical protein